MATTTTTTKRKTSSTSKTTRKPRTPTKTIHCIGCDKDKPIANNFLSSGRPEYAETGYCNICKDCLMNLMLDEKTGLMDKKRFKEEVCFRLDMPFIPALYTRLSLDPKIKKGNFIGKYKQQINLNREWSKMCFADSAKFVDIANEKLFDLEEQEVTAEMVEFWGEGHNNKYYIRAQKKYDFFMENETNEEIDYKKQSDYKFLVQLELKKDEMVADPEVKAIELKNIQEAISKLSQDLNIKVIQKNEDKMNKDHFRVGLTTKWIEDVKKEPIPFFTEVYGGNFFDGFKELLQLYFLSPIYEALGLRNPFRAEYEADMAKYSPSKDELDRERELAKEFDIEDEFDAMINSSPSSKKDVGDDG